MIMEITRQRVTNYVLFTVWLLIAICAFNLYYPLSAGEIRKIQGVVTHVSENEMTIDVSRTAFLIYPNYPEIKSHRFTLNRNTKYMLDRYLVVDGVIVSILASPLVSRSEVIPGDSVFVHLSDNSSLAELVLVSHPVLWY